MCFIFEVKKKYLFILFSFITFFQTFSQEKAVQKVVDDFFDAFHVKDTLQLRKMAHDKIVLSTIVSNGNKSKMKIENYDDFLNTIVSIPDTVVFLEKIINYEIKIDAHIAHVWTPYEFYVNGKLSHKGVNSFTLVKEENSWEIVHLIDTRRKD